MRKLLFSLIVAVLAVSGAFAASPNYYYTVQPSTYPITESGTMAAQKSGDTIKVKQITIHQIGTTAQVITLYAHAASTTTVTEVIEYSVPGVVGDYTVSIPANGDAGFTTQNLLDAPNFCVRSTSSTNTPRVSLIYIKP
jgi:hypothetical protein